ncbi:glycosyltransferase [Aquimarina rubra]|uniref:Glycosyltransferase n=1 Tax=Aquimarina rubra TaxID=1920033 RepID=A0ABW5L9L1_9FLAO
MASLKILFASIPADGHFNPMTELAVYLKEKGHDVRWYTGKAYEGKLKQMGVPYIPFRKAKEIKISELDEAYPERKKLKGVSHIKFDIINLFINRIKDYYEDIAELSTSFPFDIVICDNAFPGTIIKDKLNTLAVSIGVDPLTLSSPDLPQYGLGHQPASTFLAKRKQNFIKLMADKLIFNDIKISYNNLLKSLGLPEENHNIFDAAPLKSDLFLQSGIPELDYPRHFIPESIKYVGALNTWNSKSKKAKKDWKNILDLSKKTILVSQGTVDKNNKKLIIPTLEAFKDSNYNILVATGYNDTKSLKMSYPQNHIYIEDYISYDTVMPLADIFITNGGYGSTMQSIKNGLPMVMAGINEGKNEICARMDYSEIAINLNTEKPRVVSIQNAVNKIMNTKSYHINIKNIQRKLATYDTLKICEQHIQNLISQ